MVFDRGHQPLISTPTITMPKDAQNGIFAQWWIAHAIPQQTSITGMKIRHLTDPTVIQI
jgi:hypothetical protein